ncbi:hypothetical protein AMTRI_Chr07g26680 [Amborella trichopoda]
MAQTENIWRRSRDYEVILFVFFLASIFISAEHNSVHISPKKNGCIIGFFGAVFGNVGVVGRGVFVPMTLIIGFDAKSSRAISKYMIMAPTPHITCPMLGISIRIVFNVIFADWMVTILLIILFIGTSTKAFMRSVETWKKETILKKEAAKLLESSKLNGCEEVECTPLPSGPRDCNAQSKASRDAMELSILVFVWVAFFVLQLVKTNTTSCLVKYSVLNLILAGIVGGPLGLGGSYILGKRYPIHLTKYDQNMNVSVIFLLQKWQIFIFLNEYVNIDMFFPCMNCHSAFNLHHTKG